MVDYIKRSDALELAREYYTPALREEAVPVKAIRNIPSADVVDLNDLEKGCFYGVGTDGVFYKLYPRIKLPLAKKINVETGEIIYPTNADRIRAMSDAELAREFTRLDMFCCPVSGVTCAYEPKCQDCFKRWLEQEAKT